MSDPNAIRDVTVPVTTPDGKTKMEPWAFSGQQSDGSTWHVPTPLAGSDHDHYFTLTHPWDREVRCSCGHGGDFFPHNAHIENGHIYKKELHTGKIAENCSCH
jgi:hypothetical protein